MVGNHSQSVKAEGSLTARDTSRAGTKVGLSDLVAPYGPNPNEEARAKILQIHSRKLVINKESKERLK